MRSGTLNVSGIIGFGEACSLMTRQGEQEAERLRKQRNRLWFRLQEEIEDVERNGAPLEHTLPHSLNVYIPGVDAETLRMMVPHIAFSTGSACSAKSNDPSHVLKALYPDEPDRWGQSIRLSLGRFTTDEEVEQAAEGIVEAVKRARDIENQM